MKTKRRLLIALVLASTAAIGFTGCSAMGSGGDESASVDEAPAENAPAATDGEEVDTAVVITGRISIVAGDPITAAGEATSIVTDAGGRVSGRTERAAEDGGQASAELTLRIPADAIEEVRAALADLGEVKETALDSTEVGATQRDLAARITTLRASIARYTDWLGTASKTSDLIELESAIAERQTELEGLEAQSRALEDQVAMSTITLSLVSEYVPVVTAPQNFGEALAVGWAGFGAFWGTMLIAIGVGLPWLVLIAAVIACVIWLVGRNRRRRDARPPLAQVMPDPALFAMPEQTPPAPR
ncbi:DUF4349 domain-containing protein [Microbacterium sp. W4I20]|uniref:DUF4349 domain-containing protein n=1 Tax=Microbacterium sp. W4I20 TaxID=3042262 RepID=UPI002781FDFE|nr:DUF4349 domain-containing protein [Microbacterium sp. W4I20]MDQ0725437.1 hypothetical protein [Microbacterium sp. W4I20]